MRLLFFGSFATALSRERTLITFPSTTGSLLLNAIDAIAPSHIPQACKRNVLIQAAHHYIKCWYLQCRVQCPVHVIDHLLCQVAFHCNFPRDTWLLHEAYVLVDSIQVQPIKSSLSMIKSYFLPKVLKAVQRPNLPTSGVAAANA